MLARLDADDAFEVLERMGGHDAHETFARRLRFVWGQRLETMEGPAAFGEDGRRADRRLVIEVVHATDAVCDALRNRATSARFREIGAADGGDATRTGTKGGR